jgi:hypothetical protein
VEIVDKAFSKSDCFVLHEEKNERRLRMTKKENGFIEMMDLLNVIANVLKDLNEKFDFQSLNDNE